MRCITTFLLFATIVCASGATAQDRRDLWGCTGRSRRAEALLKRTIVAEILADRRSGAVDLSPPLIAVVVISVAVVVACCGGVLFLRFRRSEVLWRRGFADFVLAPLVPVLALAVLVACWSMTPRAVAGRRAGKLVDLAWRAAAARSNEDVRLAADIARSAHPARAQPYRPTGRILPIVLTVQESDLGLLCMPYWSALTDSVTPFLRDATAVLLVDYSPPGPAVSATVVDLRSGAVCATSAFVQPDVGNSRVQVKMVPGPVMWDSWDGLDMTTSVVSWLQALQVR